MAPRVGFEPTTDRLTVDCSTAELSRKTDWRIAGLAQVASFATQEIVTKQKMIRPAQRLLRIFFCCGNREPLAALLLRCWPRGGMVTQRTANPCIPVRFRARPPTDAFMTARAHTLKGCQSMAQFATIRRNMVDTQLRTYDVTNKKLLDAIESVGREFFVPESMRGLAYLDQPIRLTTSVQEARTLLTPMVLARMLQAAEIESGSRILDVAGGAGYTAAVMAAMGADVTMLESSSEMAELAQKSLTNAGIAVADKTDKGISVQTGGLAKGLPKADAFDIIFINGAIETEPTALLKQLKDGGRLIAVLGTGRAGRVTIFQKTGEITSKRSILDASAPVLAEFRKEAEFKF
jgi:protein-L-isoaspartate(D-aspartate) O-methyltransferase